MAKSLKIPKGITKISEHDTTSTTVFFQIFVSVIENNYCLAILITTMFKPDLYAVFP
jgi:hypothetical protein